MSTAVRWAVASAVIALGVLVFADGTAEIIGFELLLLVVVLVALRPVLRSGRRPVPDFEYRRKHTHRIPSQLVEVERLVAFSQTSRVDFHHRLLPRLQAIAGDRLAARHGLDLRRDPEQAARLIGAEAWEFLRPAAQPVDDVVVPGPSTIELDRIVTALEDLADEPGGPV